MPVADELVTVLGVKVPAGAMNQLERFRAGVAGVQKAYVALAAAISIGAVTAGVQQLISGTIAHTSELTKLSEKARVSTTDLQEWAYAAGQVGASASAVQGDLAGLAEKFRYSGRDADKTMMQLADRMKGMDLRKAQSIGKFYGLSDDTIRLLRQGSDEIAKFREQAQKSGGIISEAQIARVKEFQARLSGFQFQLKGVTTQLAIALMPALSGVIDRFSTWLTQNQEFVNSTFASVMQGIVNGFDRFMNVLKIIGNFFQPFVDKLSEMTGGMDTMEIVTHLVTGALEALLILFAPLIAKAALVIAGFVLLSIVAEDLFSSITKGEGAFANFFRAAKDRWPELFKSLEYFGSLLKDFIPVLLRGLLTLLKGAFSVLGDVFGYLLDRVSVMSKSVREWFQGFEDRFPNLVKWFNDSSESTGKFEKALEILGTVAKMAFQPLLALLEAIGAAIDLVISGIDKAIGLAESVGIIGSSAGYQQSRSKYAMGAYGSNNAAAMVPEGVNPNAIRHRSTQFELPKTTADKSNPMALDTTQRMGMGGTKNQTQNNNVTVNQTITGGAAGEIAQASANQIMSMIPNSGSYAPVAG